MLLKRPLGTAQSISLLSALLVTTAFTVPAYAQVETIVVTAEKKAEDLQSVPIAVTAFSERDLAARQINTYQDLQFNVPSVTNTKGNFTSSNFEIRGIGASGTGAAVESGVAFNVNDLYLNSPAIAETEYYDVDRIELLRGPQSTLYGRNATGGTVNVITTKPDLETFSGDGEVEYGNYNDVKVRGDVNLPLMDGMLGVRISGLSWTRDGTVTNLYDGHKDDSRDQYSVRGSLRFEPASGTTIDVMIQASSEDDSHMRSQKSLCHYDPSGVLGCLPDKTAFQTPNLASTLGNIYSSPEFYAVAFTLLPSALQGYYNTAAPGLGLPNGQTMFEYMGLFGNSITAPPSGSGFNPADMHKIYTDFDPKYHANETLLTGQWKQRINDWLDATLVTGYQHAGVVSQQSYYNTVGDPIVFSDAQIGLINAMAGPNPALFGYPTNTAAAANFGLIHVTPIGGGYNVLSIPVSAYDKGEAGVIGGKISHYSDLNSGSDLSSGSDTQKSVELRFNSNLDGPLNFLLAGYYLDYNNVTDYYVGAPALDYTTLMLASMMLPVSPLLTGATPGVPMGVGPSVYHNAEVYSLTSKAVFGEVYYDLVPDTLKLTGGLRYTEDHKSLTGRTTLFNAFAPIGTTNLNPAITDPSIGLGGLSGATDYNTKITNNDAVTGRAVLDYLVAAARRRGAGLAYLHAQVPVEGFYLKYGFTPVGDVFPEAGIPHRRMKLAL